MTFLRVLEITGSKGIGLQISFSFVILCSSGTVEGLTERLHICAIGVARTFDPSFRERPDRLSIPVALLAFNSFRKSDMVFSETLVK